MNVVGIPLGMICKQHGNSEGGGELVETNRKGPCKNQTKLTLGTKFEGNDGGDGRSTMKMDENHFCFVLLHFL